MCDHPSFGGFFGGGYGRSARHSQPSGRLTGVPQRFLELLPKWVDTSYFQDCMESLSLVLLSRYRFKRSSKFMSRASSLLAWADVRVGFPRTLVRVVALMAFFCSIYSFLCNCWGSFDRHLTSEGCNTLFTAKTLSKAWCAPYYKNTIT